MFLSLDELVQEEVSLPVGCLTDLHPPGEGDWCMPLLHHYDVRGDVRQWQVSYVSGRLIFESGVVGGKLLSSSREVVVNTRQLSLNDQAWSDARGHFRKKLRKGYLLPGDALPGKFEVMSGQPYQKELGKLYPAHGWPVFVEAKLDGLRHFIVLEHGQLRICSREGISRPHLVPLFKDCLVALLSRLPPGTILDTEFYRHGEEFERLNSWIRTREVTEEAHQLEIWIFDITWDCLTPFEERRHRLELALFDYYQSCQALIEQDEGEEVPSTQGQLRIGRNPRTYGQLHCSPGFVAHTVEDIMSWKDILASGYVEGPDAHMCGYEGVMIKRMSRGYPVGSDEYKMSTYFYGKTARIYKYKTFYDAEALCIDVLPGDGDERDCAVLKLQMPNGNVFKSRPDGSFSRRRLWLANPSLVLGKWITYTYQELTTHGLPRFPTARRIREDYVPPAIV